MMSILEQRQIVESAFLPLSCRCTIGADNKVTLELRKPMDERVLLSVADIQRDELASSRSISQVVLRVRQLLACESTGIQKTARHGRSFA